MYLLSRLCPQSHPSRGERVFAGPGYNQSATLLLGERSVIVFPSGFLKTTKQNQWPSGVTHPRLLIFKHGDGWGNRAVLVKGTGDGTRFRRLTKWQKGVKRQAGGWGGRGGTPRWRARDESGGLLQRRPELWSFNRCSRRRPRRPPGLQTGSPPLLHWRMRQLQRNMCEEEGF